MGLFSPKRTLGIDIGTSKLKVVELTQAKGGKAELSTYGLGNLPADLVRQNSDHIIQEITITLRRILEKAGMKGRRVYASLPGFAVFSQEIVLPGKLKKKQLREAVNTEAIQHIPGDVSEMVIDWEVLEDVIPLQPGETRPNVTRVLLTAAPKKLVERYGRMFAAAGLELESLETEAMALVRSNIGRDQTPALIVDMGATATDIIIVQGAMPRFTRTIDLGGLSITEALSKNMQVGIEQAEQFKKDAGMGLQKAADGNMQPPAAMQPVLKDVITEIQRVSNVCAEQNGKAPERILLAGGAAKLIGLDVYLQQETGTQTVIGNPFARVLHPPELDTLLREVGPDLSVSIGLAMKEIY